jgi:hypothetical protein
MIASEFQHVEKANMTGKENGKNGVLESKKGVLRWNRGRLLEEIFNTFVDFDELP